MNKFFGFNTCSKLIILFFLSISIIFGLFAGYEGRKSQLIMFEIFDLESSIQRCPKSKENREIANYLLLELNKILIIRLDYNTTIDLVLGRK